MGSKRFSVRFGLDLGSQRQIIWLTNTGTDDEPACELAGFSLDLALLTLTSLCLRRGGRRGSNRHGNGAAAGCLCVGERAERHPDAIAEDGAKYAIRSRKDAHRKMEG